MSAPLERQGVALAPEAASLVETYFARVHGALLIAATDECEEMVEDLRMHVLEELEGGSGSAADVTRVLAELGSPEALAAQCADAAEAEPPSRDDASEARSVLSGRVLGVPYDLRFPTAERVASQWWNPVDQRLFLPRVFGMGWTVNFGAAAVMLGLVRPDDEDVPFGAVPERWLAVALAVPLALGAALAVLVAMFQAGLPAQVATHFGVSGVADGFSSKLTALLLPAGMTLFGVAMAVWTWLRMRPPLSRVAVGALATMLAGISVGVYAQGVATARGVAGATTLYAALAGALLLPFALLVILARVGRRAEQRRDLGEASKKGSVR